MSKIIDGDAETIQSAADVVREDLERIVADLADELSHLSGQRLLITGGAGFLGYYLVQAITHYNQHSGPKARIGLSVFDHFGRGAPAWLTDLRDQGALTLRRHDMTQPLPADMGDFQWIIHAASIASPIYYRQHPIETMDANVNGLRNLLDYAVRQNETGKPVRGMLFYSSSEIYGDPDPAHIPTPETYRGLVSCTGPRACYDEAKRYGETLCVNFAQRCGVAVKMARPFNNYGPGLKITDGRVICDFMRDVLAGRDIVMLSDGLARRTFCYASDAITGYYKILVNGQAGEPYNIGVETPEISMRELGERITALGARWLGYGGTVVTAASQDAAYLVDNPTRRCPIITKAREQLGYTPQVDLDEGLRRSLAWYVQNQGGGDA